MKKWLTLLILILIIVFVAKPLLHKHKATDTPAGDSYTVKAITLPHYPDQARAKITVQSLTNNEASVLNPASTETI